MMMINKKQKSQKSIQMTINGISINLIFLWIILDNNLSKSKKLRVKYKKFKRNNSLKMIMFYLCSRNLKNKFLFSMINTRCLKIIPVDQDKSCLSLLILPATSILTILELFKTLFKKFKEIKLDTKSLGNKVSLYQI